MSVEPIVPERNSVASDAAPAGMPLMARLLLFLVGLVAVAAIAVSAWIYADTKRQLIAMATDIAQLRVSLDLYGQRAMAAAPAAPTAAPDDSQLQDLSNRLAILEENWRNQAASPAPPATAAAAPAAGGGPVDDCVPAGTRFLVSSGDSYAICGTEAMIEVSQVEASHVSLSNGTIIPAGGTALLPDTSCSVAVMASGPEGLTGYADIRVSC